MKLIDLPLVEAVGSLLAHSQSVVVDGKPARLKKGTLLTQSDIEAMKAARHSSVMVAMLDTDDIHEDEAARTLAEAVCGAHIGVDIPFTGRANLFAQKSGLFVPDAGLINQINGCDPALTLATLPPYSTVEAGRMVATVKVIPFAVPELALKLCLEGAGTNAVSVAPFQPANVGLIATRLPTLKESTLNKTRKVLETRLLPSGSVLSDEFRTSHNVENVAGAIKELARKNCDLILLFGASAMIDADDVLPQALRQAGGSVNYVGMPVDPGNLLFLGEIDGKPVIGAPGCARSPAENGFDWVLNRLLAGIPVGASEIASMGVGGLLMEIVSRPQPRQLEAIPANEPPQIAALLLAAGQSKRMGANNKLIAEVDGKPLIRHVAEAATGALGRDLTVVTGAQPERVSEALAGIKFQTVHNPDFDQGLSTSLRAGIQALATRKVPPDAVLVLLGDMPTITADIISQIVGAFKPANGREIIVPTDAGKRGNPVLWSARFLEALSGIHGDTGARHLIGEYAEFVHEVEVGRPVSFDLDTPDQLINAGGRFVD